MVNMFAAPRNNDIFAELTDLFGEILSPEIILNVCTSTNWHLTECIDILIRHIEENEQVNEALPNAIIACNSDQQSNETINRIQNLKITSNDYTDSNRINFDDEEDLIVESEEIQQSTLPKYNLLSPAASPFIPQGAIKKTTIVQPTYDENFNLNKAPSAMSSFASVLHDGKEFTDHQPSTKQARVSSPEVPAKYPGIIDDIRHGYKILILMRGMPGSGKSFLAQRIINETMNQDYKNHIFSSDDYFYNRQNQYQYNRHKIADAHEFNQTRVRQRLSDGWSPIIVDNTSSEIWEMFVYVRMAVTHGYLIQILEPNTRWCKSAGRLAMRNIHNVPKDKIERMLQRFEPTTVDFILQSLNLSYTCSMPQIRKNPLPPSVDWKCAIGDCSGTAGNGEKPIIKPNLNLSETVWDESWSMSTDSNRQSVNETADGAGKPRVERSSNENVPRSYTPPLPSKNSQTNDEIEDTFEVAKRKMELLSNEWVAFEKERAQFWGNSEPTNLPAVAAAEVATGETQVTRTQLATPPQAESQIVSILKDNVIQPKVAQESKGKKNLIRHKKDCPNENRSFAQIRQIYPTVPLEILWDLFLNCNGDADWTMDILLKEESRIDDFQNNKIESDFECKCGNRILPASNQIDLVNSSTVEMISSKQSAAHNREPRTRRTDRHTQHKEESLNVKKIIEENCIIPDQYYSEHIRKIRNIRHGMQPQQHMITVTGLGYSQDNADCLDETAAIVDNESAASGFDGPSDDSGSQELLEIKLGAELICQLDSVFGIDAFQNDSIRNLKTNVFMPKELAKQLYALWMESLFNQVEEQRQQSIKEDEEFARSIQAQQNFPSSLEAKKSQLAYKDVMDMEFAWAAYKANIEHGWKLSSRQDMATHMTRAKLCELFPNVDRNTLHEMLEAYENNFDETVEVLKKNLNQTMDVNIERNSRELMEKAQAEMEAVPKSMVNLRSSVESSQRSLEIKKLGPDEAKRAALAEFEECRNMAMHHTQLKAECYRKAQEVIQRGDAGTALYYSQIANLHKTKIDMYNHKAANAMMEVHNLTQNNPDMLDLHYLHVVEAVQCLDIFLDKHITKLKSIRQAYKYIFVITGRGLHSSGGISAIKHRVKIRLKERFLSWSEVNPGLLKVRIQANSRFSN